MGVTSTDPRVLARMANLALGRKDAPAAIACLLRAAALAPELAALHANLAAAFDAEGRSAEAESSYLHAIALAPDLTVARTGLARVLSNQGRLTDAARHLNHMIRIGANPLGMIAPVCAYLRAAGAKGARDERAQMLAGFDRLLQRAARFLMSRTRIRPLLRLACTIEHAPELKQLAARLWTAPVDHYWKLGNWRMVTRLYQRYAAFSGRCRAIYAGYQPRAQRRLDPAIERDLQRRLNEARTAWQDAPDHPPLRHVLARPDDRPLSSFGNFGVVVCINMASPRGRASIFGPAIANSALRYGIRSEMLDLEEQNRIGVEPYRALLAQTVERCNARLVIIESNSISDADALNAAWARAFRAASGVKVCITLPDAHSNAIHEGKFRYWHDSVDRITYFEPSLSFGPDLADKVMLTSVVCNEDEMFDAGKTRDIPASFIGAFKYSRAYWLAAAANSPVGLYMGRDIGGAFTTSADYVDVLQRSQMALSFGAREGGISIVTARVWEAIHCGALLLEEHGSRLDRFLVPYVHYVPFHSANDLIDKCLFFEKHADLAATLAREARTFAIRWYGSERYWTRLANALFA
jgi:tetratricopeptide (TPR) repeat protein